MSGIYITNSNNNEREYVDMRFYVFLDENHSIRTYLLPQGVVEEFVC